MADRAAKTILSFVIRRRFHDPFHVSAARARCRRGGPAGRGRARPGTLPPGRKRTVKSPARRRRERAIWRARHTPPPPATTNSTPPARARTPAGAKPAGRPGGQRSPAPPAAPARPGTARRPPARERRRTVQALPASRRRETTVALPARILVTCADISPRRRPLLSIRFPSAPGFRPGFARRSAGARL